MRLKLALTEENHKAVVADEAAWAKLNDSRNGPIDLSLELFQVLQQRWVVALQRFPMRTLSEQCGIRRGARCPWTMSFKAMPGTLGTTLPTLQACESAWDGYKATA